MKITYLSHSGFLIESESAYLLFDYYKGEIPVLKKEKPLAIFVSHSHHDHYNKDIFQLFHQMTHVTYYLSDDIKTDTLPEHLKNNSSSEREEVIFLGPDEKLSHGGLEIETLLSTDEGVAFQVDLDGQRLFHAGDLHWWHWIGDPDSENEERKKKFIHEINKIEGRYFDAAFLVLDPRQEEAFDWGFDYFMKHTHTKAAFPMHFWGDHSVISAYCSSPKAVEIKDRVMNIQKEGQFFFLHDK